MFRWHYADRSEKMISKYVLTVNFIKNQKISHFTNGFTGFFSGFSDCRQMSHFASRSRFGFAVKMKFDVWDFQHFCPIRFAVFPQIAEQICHRRRLKNSVEPSGRPQTARNCCSNCEVTHASKVRCPELCGRGAISLMISFSFFVRKNSTHRVPT